MGDHIVVSGDVNEDIFHEDIASIFDKHGMSLLVYR
jgi:hypothetical protein